ncbi:helix-turn-helix domain-containing protein [Lentzea sp. NPDC042327]|uniref:helix-turn-helix domain-containing protein n=1 Tax=Lentzea sp. NPDC042327 TaxID=3154801 RepID=UPI0033F71776
MIAETPASDRQNGCAGCRCVQTPLQELRGHVVRVARDREPGVTVEQIAEDFGVRPTTLFKWLRRARCEPGWFG